MAVLKKVNPYKAKGPDGLGGRIFKDCAEQLGNVMTRLFQLLMDTNSVPIIWKTSTIIPIPKKTGAKELQDFRPVALTPILSKCLEKVICSHLKVALCEQLDPLQFAYRAKRGVEEASLTLIQAVTEHLDRPKACARILFMDFSSAFNTVNIATLSSRLSDLKVHSAVILWIEEFLHNRPQKVKVNDFMSDSLVVNTGVPQGCILSPILFSVYTSEMKCNTEHLTLVKYADDMALVARLTNAQSLNAYINYVAELTSWFEDSHLLLNITKTKEMCLDSNRKNKLSNFLFKPVTIKGQEVEQVSSFKYLGTVLDQSLTFTEHMDCIYKKAQQRLFLLRKLRSFEVSQCTLNRVYQSLIESVLTFNIVSWFENLTVKNKTKLSKVVKLGSKITGCKQTQLSHHYERAVKRLSNKILDDCSHPLHHCFQLLPSGQRYRVPCAKKNIYKKSFVPVTIKYLNQ